jgi:hypothetical protein
MRYTSQTPRIATSEFLSNCSITEDNVKRHNLHHLLRTLKTQNLPRVKLPISRQKTIEMSQTKDSSLRQTYTDYNRLNSAIDTTK